MNIYMLCGIHDCVRVRVCNICLFRYVSICIYIYVVYMGDATTIR